MLIPRTQGPRHSALLWDCSCRPVCYARSSYWNEEAWPVQSFGKFTLCQCRVFKVELVCNLLSPPNSSLSLFSTWTSIREVTKLPTVWTPDFNFPCLLWALAFCQAMNCWYTEDKNLWVTLCTSKVQCSSRCSQVVHQLPEHILHPRVQICTHTFIYKPRQWGNGNVSLFYLGATCLAAWCSLLPARELKSQEKWFKMVSDGQFFRQLMFGM